MIDAERFVVAFVPGVTVTKWARVWRERHPSITLEAVPIAEDEQERVLRERSADMCFVRLPIEREGLSAIPLYSEAPVVVAARDHAIEAVDAVTLAELEGETFLEPPHDTVEMAATGAGLIVIPQSIARQQSRRDVVYRPVTDAPETRIALAWLEGQDSPLVEEFIGIVRGRTAASSRGAAPTAAPAPAPARPGRSASPARKTRTPRGRDKRG